MTDLQSQEYQKHHSFENFKTKQASVVEYQSGRALRILNDWQTAPEKSNQEVAQRTNYAEVLHAALEDLGVTSADARFKITPFIAQEMATYSDQDILRFLYHRYRYDVFPQLRKLDDYPPYLQIEPAALCNYRCVFCYQTDTDYFKRGNPAMGQMDLGLFKEIVDMATGKVEFLSIASRGEPLLCREIDEMLRYTEGRFLNLKLNTNASLLNENHIHAILSGGVKTIVFSADAAEEPLYSQLRVNGKLDLVKRNIDRFNTIRQKDYSGLQIISRVSGVKYTEEQSIGSMDAFWGDVVDQVAFVNYNPWENVYTAEPNGIKKHCSDLWRRMFVWHDGETNPCDTDYKSTLSVGNISDGISDRWRSEPYELLRGAHESESRQIVEPCKRCNVV